MPHVTVKLFPGRTEDQKKHLTLKIVEAIIETLNTSEVSISVLFEEIPMDKWENEVYKHDILGKEKMLYKKPGY